MLAGPLVVAWGVVARKMANSVARIALSEPIVSTPKAAAPRFILVKVWIVQSYGVGANLAL